MLLILTLRISIFKSHSLKFHPESFHFLKYNPYIKPPTKPLYICSLQWLWSSLHPGPTWAKEAQSLLEMNSRASLSPLSLCARLACRQKCSSLVIHSSSLSWLWAYSHAKQVCSTFTYWIFLWVFNTRFSFVKNFQENCNLTLCFWWRVGCHGLLSIFDFCRFFLSSVGLFSRNPLALIPGPLLLNNVNNYCRCPSDLKTEHAKMCAYSLSLPRLP